jgi:hypothetical protein
MADDLGIALHGVSFRIEGLFRRVTECVLGLRNHAPEIADAFGAFGRALATAEDIGGAPGALRYGGVGVAFADTVAVAHVHGSIRAVDAALYTYCERLCNSFA